MSTSPSLKQVMKIMSLYMLTLSLSFEQAQVNTNKFYVGNILNMSPNPVLLFFYMDVHGWMD
jgi:hypothetical protein